MALEYGGASGISVQVGGPYGDAGSKVKLTEISLPVAGWKGAISPYSQVVAVDGISVNSMVNLQLTADQLEQFRDQVFALTAENDGGVVTVYAIGDKPASDAVVQATIVEVIS